MVYLIKKVNSAKNISLKKLKLNNLSNKLLQIDVFIRLCFVYFHKKIKYYSLYLVF